MTAAWFSPLSRAPRSVRLALVLFGTGALLVLSVLAWQRQCLGAWVREPSRDVDLYLRVAKGDSFKTIARRLVTLGWVGTDLPMRWEARRRGWDRRVYPGYYHWRRGERVQGLLERLARGEIEEAKVTFPEGWRAARILAVLADSANVPLRDLEQLAGDPAFLKSEGVPGPGIEGYLLPDTYRVPKGEDPRFLLHRLIAPAVGFYRDSLAVEASARGLDMRTLWTMASIIESEAARADERPRIASVYWNRLKLGMRLEADPTVLFALGRAPGRVTFADLAVESPYNTYRNTGLPPGPICCPGRAALRAAAHPVPEVDALFFVARGDGSHVFSRTFAQHSAAVRALRAARKPQTKRAEEP